jgi:dTDP-4-dehydrorhamnose 3,5-epimerase
VACQRWPLAAFLYSLERCVSSRILRVEPPQIASAGLISTAQPIKDKQTVSPDGQPLNPQIAGVVLDRRVLQEDERGELIEIYNPAWGLSSDPLVYAYMVSIRPGQVKGWVLHKHQDDRLFIVRGVIRIALFDNRTESPTYRMLSVQVISERGRALLIIPKGVYHALKNIGDGDCSFINLPTVPYQHADPDKYRLPLRNDLIPFAFEGGLPEGMIGDG